MSKSPENVRPDARARVIEPPRELVQAIASGSCVAFVGAGFSGAAGGKSWSELLRAIGASGLGARHATRRFVEDAMRGDRRPSAHELDQAAQLLEDALGPERFREALQAELRVDWSEAMRARVDLLRGIPFRAILTTNYDHFLEQQPHERPHHAVLRRRPRRWIARLLEAADQRWTTPVVKLHGDIGEPLGAVITRRDYRRRLYDSSGYLTFLRSVMATQTVLYLGFSFTDAYLNELRSEVLAMLDEGGGRAGNGGRRPPPAAFAIVPDLRPQQQRYFRAHEGVRVLSYDAKQGHAPFDAFLQRLHDETNPVRRFALSVAGRRLLWVDPAPDNNSEERRILRSVCSVTTAAPPTIVEERSHRRAAALLAEQPFDLVIASWGAPAPEYDGLSPGVWLARRIRTSDLAVPFLFYAGSDDPKRKAEAARLGAHAYSTRWEELFPAVERVLSLVADAP